jgi:hypothetical protein
LQGAIEAVGLIDASIAFEKFGVVLEAAERGHTRLLLQTHEGRIDLGGAIAAFGRPAFRKSSRNGAVVLAQHEIEDALIFREAVLQGDRFGQHFHPLDGIAREVCKFRNARQMPVDKHNGRSIAAAAAGRRFQCIDQIA